MSLPEPVTRKEQYLNEIATGEHTKPGYPVTREEMYLDAIAEGGGSGGTGYQTITGNPLEFDSPSPQMVGMKCDIVASQDLHGYDKPWAGGSGNNFLPPISFQDQTVDGMNYSTDGNGEYYIDGVNGVTQTRVDVDIEPITLPQTVYLHLNNPTASSYAVIGFSDEGGTLIDYASGNAVNRIVNMSTNLGGKTVARITISVYGNGANVDEFSMQPMLTVSSEPTTFEPYSNICPIEGTDTIDIDVAGGESYTIDLDGTRYGGTLDVGSGVLTLTHGEIASYDGETLPSEWISDRDEYEAGTTPTTGAQVVYELATPQTVQLTPTQVWAVQGGNTITVSVDGVEAEINTSNYATFKDIEILYNMIKGG